MPNRNRALYALRLNALKKATADGAADTPSLLSLAAGVEGINAADLNYPDHVSEENEAAVAAILQSQDMHLNGLAMRYYGEPAFAIGAFTNPDPAIRQKAIDQTRRGIDCAARLGAGQMTLWMGQDGFDYAFQLDYAKAWDDTVSAIAEVADHNPQIDIAIEYKPNEPRAFSLMPDVGTTLLATKELNRANVGVTLDFAHVLYADEMPAHAAHLVARHSRLLGVHLNDGYGKRDDGLMAGTVHPVATVELFVELHRIGYDGVIYFDTFPDHSGLDPLEEARGNVRLVERLRQVANTLKDDADLQRAISQQDATQSQRIVAAALFGR
jgi:sugar phosphate isomerase/epimerase